MGVAPSGFENVGYCTQIAIFAKNTNLFNDIPKNGNKFAMYLKEKKNLHFKNRQIQFASNNTELKHKQDNYFDFAPFEQENFSENAYKLVSAISYPFESFEFDNEADRKCVFLEEIKSTICFLTQTFKGFGRSYPNDEKTNRDEEKEKLESNIDVDDDNIRLVSINKLFEFPALKKFNYTTEQMLDIIKNNGFIFTASKKYIIHSILEESNHESDRSEEFDNQQSAILNQNQSDEEWN